MEALDCEISRFAGDLIRGEYEDASLLPSLLNWKDEVLVPFVREALEGGERRWPGDDEQFDGNDVLRDGWDARLDRAICECYCQVRSEEMFELVADYPDSL